MQMVYNSVRHIHLFFVGYQGGGELPPTGHTPLSRQTPDCWGPKAEYLFCAMRHIQNCQVTRTYDCQQDGIDRHQAQVLHIFPPSHPTSGAPVASQAPALPCSHALWRTPLRSHCDHLVLHWNTYPTLLTHSPHRLVHCSLLHWPPAAAHTVCPLQAVPIPSSATPTPPHLLILLPTQLTSPTFTKLLASSPHYLSPGPQSPHPPSPTGQNPASLTWSLVPHTRRLCSVRVCIG
jgi:hypothetical protein